MVASKLTGAAAFAALISLTAAQAPVWGQCGGIGFTGPTSCAAGSVCTFSNDYYSQCIPGTGGGTTTTTTRTTTRTTTTSSRTTTTSPKISTTTTTTSRTTTGGGTSPTGLIGYGAGTTGGGNASPITVTSCDALKTALNNNNPKVVRISGVLSGCGAISVGSNTSLLGATSNSGISNGRFSVSSKTNVIIRNLVLGPAPLGDDIVTIIASTKVWIDHNTFKSVGIVGDKDDYDGLLDFTQGSDYCTVSWNKFQDHWKTSLTGSADTTGSTDRGKFHITWHNNWYENVYSRAPLGRWTTSHIFNNYYHKMQTAVNVRIESNIRVQNCYFEEIASETVWGTTEGAGCESGSYFVDAPTPNIAKQCTHNPPYSYTLATGSAVKSIVTAGAGHGKISV